jgi:hypothetical protein
VNRNISRSEVVVVTWVLAWCARLVIGSNYLSSLLDLFNFPFATSQHLLQQDIPEDPAPTVPYNKHAGPGRSEHKLDIGDTVRMQAPTAVAYGGLQDLPSPSGRLSDRIERLRQRCTEALGRDAFRDAYQFLKQHEEVKFMHLSLQSVCLLFFLL